MVTAIQNDPTLEAMEAIQDPARWDRYWDEVRDVFVFEPHTRQVRGEDGKAREIVVDEARLKRVADKINRRFERTGTPVKMICGHSLPPGTPQERQPRVLGYAANARVEPWGPEGRPGLKLTRYVRKGCLGEVKELPQCSPEFYDKTDDLTAVALLRQDPFLDMGLTLYQDGRRPVLYQRGDGCILYGDVKMADEPKTPPAAEPAASPPALDPTMPMGDAPPALDPAVKGQMDQYMKECYPHLQAMHAAYAKGVSPTQYQDGPPPAAAIPSATNALPVAEPAKTDYARQAADQIQYNRVVAELNQLKAEREKERLDYARAEATRIVTQLADLEGYQIPDAAKEIERMARLSAAERAEREQEIRTCYQRGPVGAPVQTARVPAPKGSAPEFGERQLDGATQYMRENRCTWEVAEKWARENVK